MIISKETQDKIKNLFKNNPEMIEKLCNCDAEAIREIGSISQKGIDPDDVIAAYESGDKDTLNYLYQQAKRLLGLKELYKDLCYEYYRKMKATPSDQEDIKINETTIKK